MISYDEAISIVKKGFSSFQLPVIEIKTEESSGYILAEDIISDTPLPLFDNSSMDGFAVIFNSGITEWKIIGEISAGNYNGLSLNENSTIRIMTGGRIPVSADTVILLEDVIETDNRIRLRDKVKIKQGQNVRQQGEDLTSGSVTLKAGTLLKPQHISLAAACGKPLLKVYRKLKAGILATGDELIDIKDKPDGDKIRATNLYMLISLVSEAGMIPVNLGIVKDDKLSLAVKVSEALQSDIDILISTGGVSVGKYDYMKEIFIDAGVEILFEKVNVRPGKPVVFGKYKSKLIFGLPGNPVSSFVSFLLFIKQLTPTVIATTESSFRKNDSKRHFIRGIVKYDYSKKKFFVSSTGSQSSGNMAGLGNSNILIVLREEQKNINPGEEVECILI